jgi:formyltetrahydrofolate deformylase
MTRQARILIDCKDETGLVYKVSKIFYDNDLNIEGNREFVDKVSGRFFMRSVVEGAIDTEQLRKDITAVLPSDADVKVLFPGKKKLILMVTKESHALGDILIRHQAGELEAEVLAVIGNHNNLESLVNRFDIPFHHVPAEGLLREEHEQKVKEVIDNYRFDYIVLAKYMRILTPAFVSYYKNRLINIHHSFLPAFVGANPYKQAFERGVKIIGATAHFVTDRLDEGPIIAQDVIPVNHRFSWKDMQRAGRDVEKIVLSRAVSILLEDRIFVHNNKTIIL